MRTLCFLLFLGCGGEKPQEAPAPAAPPAPTAPPAAAPAPAEVGPDGPTSIAVPEMASIPTDAESAAKGEAIWGARGCGGCHAFGTKVVGPDLTDLTGRRSLPWVERMILEPERMVKEDPAAKELFKTHMVQMPRQGVTPDELPALLAYIKSKGG